MSGIFGKFKEINRSEIRNKRDGATEKLQTKPVLTYLDNEVNTYFNDNNLKNIFVTLNFDTTTPYSMAWERIRICRHAIENKIYETYGNKVHLICSTIEHTHEQPKNRGELHKITTEDELKQHYMNYLGIENIEVKPKRKSRFSKTEETEAKSEETELKNKKEELSLKSKEYGKEYDQTEDEIAEAEDEIIAAGDKNDDVAKKKAKYKLDIANEKMKAIRKKMKALDEERAKVEKEEEEAKAKKKEAKAKAKAEEAKVKAEEAKSKTEEAKAKTENKNEDKPEKKKRGRPKKVLETTIKKVKTLKNIDEDKYTTSLLNIFTEMRYMLPYNSKEKPYKEYEKFSKFLEKRIEELTELAKKGVSYDFMGIPKGEDIIYDMDEHNLDLYLAYVQTEMKNTTLGYPHLHLGVWVESTYNMEKLRNEIYMLCRDVTGLQDIKVDLSKYQGKPATTLAYIIKNHSSKTVYNTLEKYPVKTDKGEIVGDLRIVNAIITSPQHYEKIKEMLYYIGGIEQTSNNLTSYEKSSYNKSIAMVISTTEEIERDGQTKIEHNLITLDATVNKTNEYLNYVQHSMIKNGLAICEGLVYKKIKESKTSYQYAMKIDEFLDEFVLHKKYYSVAEKVRPRLTIMLKKKSDNSIIDEEDVINFPRITINYRMIELGDCYYCVLTRKIYKTQNEYYTYVYCPSITLENMAKKMIVFLEKSIYVKQLKASGIYTIEDINKLQKCLHKRINTKEGTILIVGDSNSGKTVSIIFLAAMFPTHTVGVLTEISSFHLHEQAKDINVLRLNEANTILRSIKTKERGNILNLLEGQPILGNQKHGEMTVINSSTYSIVATANIEEADLVVYQNEPLVKRLQIIRTKRMNEQDIEVYTDVMAKKDLPMLLIFFGMCSLVHDHDLELLPDLEICETIGEEEKNYIKLYNDYGTERGINMGDIIYRNDVELFTYKLLENVEYLKKYMPGRNPMSNLDQAIDIMQEIEEKQRRRRKDEKDKWADIGVGVSKNMW